MMEFQGLRTVIYRVVDLEAAKRWYAQAFGVEPYFDQPFYVGFQVGGHELGLDPDADEGSPGPGGTVAYWGVADVAAMFERLIGLGAAAVAAPKEVGGGIVVATVADPSGNLVGLIHNPHFGPRAG